MCHVSKDTSLSLFLRKKEKFVSQKWSISSVTLGIKNRREVKEILTMMGKEVPGQQLCNRHEEQPVQVKAGGCGSQR